MIAAKCAEAMEAARLLPLEDEQLGNLRDQTAREGSGDQDPAKQDSGEGQGYQDGPAKEDLERTDPILRSLQPSLLHELSNATPQGSHTRRISWVV